MQKQKLKTAKTAYINALHCKQNLTNEDIMTCFNLLSEDFQKQIVKKFPNFTFIPSFEKEDFALNFRIYKRIALFVDIMSIRQARLKQKK